MVKFSYGEQTQTREFLLSKDGKTLISVMKMDLTRDPQAEMMAKIDLKGRPVRGNKDAKVTVVVYDDFQCPYCSRMHQTLNDVLKSYGDRIKVVYKDFPLMEIHPWAERAAIDSDCLAKQSADALLGFCRLRARQRTADPGRQAARWMRSWPRWTGSRWRRASGTRRTRRRWRAA